jgi:hypothetical protein
MGRGEELGPRSLMTGCAKSSADMSTSRIPWTSSMPMALNKTSILCARATTSSMCLSVASSSSASTSAASATPPAAEIFLGDRFDPRPGTTDEEEIGAFVGEHPGNGTPIAPAAP